MVELKNSIYSCEQLQLCKNVKNTENQAKHIKCKRCHQRQFLQETIPSELLRHHHKNLFPKLFSCYQTSATRSLRFCLYGFIIWTLAIAPSLSDLAKHSLPFKFRISLGGVTLAHACHPGSTNGGGTRPRPTVNLFPFQRNEYIPKMSEQTIGASGPAEGPIYRNTRRFSDELSPNWNPDIVFRDEEHTNEDRMMTKRCTDRLNVLAIWVANQWPGVKLRVTEGWNDPDTERIRSENALHYEGRAVDITTSDEDYSKYPILARLAVEAGFDWVHYKRFYVHCSVKSDSSDAALKGGCFPGDALVPVPGGGIKQMQELLPGDEVFSLDSNGNLAPDTLLTFMDVQSDVRAGRRVERAFVSIATEEGPNLHLTRNHLVYVSAAQTQPNQSRSELTYQSRPQPDLRTATAVFAGSVKTGQFVFVASSLSSSNLSITASVGPTKVTSVKVVTRSTGAYAPLTSRGNILVDQTLASCYAVIESDKLAHAVMTPTRYYHVIRQWLTSRYVNNYKRANTSMCDESRIESLTKEEGISIYSKLLYDVGYKFFPSSMFWGD